MARTQILTNNGETQYREARANGTNAVTVKAGASLAADIDFILPVSLPAAQEFLSIDSAGQLSTSAGASGTLDEAYDSGGAGAGRIITADSGAVEINGSGGLLVTTGLVEIQGAAGLLVTAGLIEITSAAGLRLNTTIPKVEFETDVAVFNWRVAANVGANDFRIQRGDQDADISDDTFDDIFLIDGSNRRVGIHALPSVDLDVNAAGLGLGRVAAIRVGSEAGQDSILQIFEDSTSRWEIGYDDSEGGLAIGRQTINLDTVMFFEDVTGDVGIGELDPDAKFHVTSTVALASLIESSNATSRLGLRASATSDANQVGVQAVGDDLQLFAGATAIVLVTAAGITIDQDTNNPSLVIDSEATSNPLITLQPVTGNARGDIAFGTARTADPSAPSEGDIWYDGTLEVMKLETGGGTRIIRSNYGPGYGLRTLKTIAAGVLTISTGFTQIAAESGTADSVDTIDSSPVAFSGETIVLTADIGDTITITEAGNILLVGTTRVLGAAGTVDTMTLIKRSDSPETWAELSYANNS